MSSSVDASEMHAPATLAAHAALMGISRQTRIPLKSWKKPRLLGLAFAYVEFGVAHGLSRDR